MNQEYDSKSDQIEEIDINDSASIDEFIKELEAKEKDLHISSEMVVELEDFEVEQVEMEEIEELLKTLPSNKLESSKFGSDLSNSSNSNNFSVTELKTEVSKLRQEVAKTSAEKNEMQETFRRRQTDFENFRNRTERERAEIFRSVLSNLAIRILPVIDNLNRALDTSENSKAEKSHDFQHFIDGISLVNHQLNEVLEEMGIQPILSLNQPFDPHYHEAVSTVATQEVPHNTIVGELIRGYRIDDKVIRPSMVKVSTNTELVNTSSEVE